MHSTGSINALPSRWGVRLHVRFHVLTIVNIKFVIVWDVTAFSLIADTV
jgi:hypothetical protein